MKKLVIVVFCFFIFLPTQIMAENAPSPEDLGEEFQEVHMKFCPINEVESYETLISNHYEDVDGRYSHLHLGTIENGQRVQNFVWPREADIHIICGGNYAEIKFYEPTWVVVY